VFSFREEFVKRLRPPRCEIRLRLFQQEHAASAWRKVALDFRIPRDLLAVIKPPPQFRLVLRRQAFNRSLIVFTVKSST